MFEVLLYFIKIIYKGVDEWPYSPLLMIKVEKTIDVKIEN